MVLGVILIDEVVAPVLQEYVPPPVADIVALCPAQIEAGVTVNTMLGRTVTEAKAVSVHPPLLTTTE